jgi:hypothetical protein
MTTSIHRSSSAPCPAAETLAGDAHPGRSVQRAGGGAAMDVPCSNTGRKITDDLSLQSDETASVVSAKLRGPHGFELDAEWVELFTNGKRIYPVKTPIPYASGTSSAALIDWMAFTVRPPEGKEHEWVIHELQDLGILGMVEELSGGYAGYKHKVHYQDGKSRLCLSQVQNLL